MSDPVPILEFSARIYRIIAAEARRRKTQAETGVGRSIAESCWEAATYKEFAQWLEQQADAMVTKEQA